MRGRRWRIGDGVSTKTWTEPWVPGFENLGCFLRVNIDDLSEAWVSSLFNHTHRWDVQKINHIFNARVAVAILKIKLSSSPCLDKWIWSKEFHGNFMVKNAYIMLLNGKLLYRGDNFSASNHSTLWKKFWRLKIPFKV